MLVTFTKMHGLGNDFIVLDMLATPLRITSNLVSKLADRHFGIGCDQVLVLEAPNAPENDFAYRIFNADGTEVEHCGNGARCIARYIQENALSDNPCLRIETLGGIITLERLADGQVKVEMGTPTWVPSAVPTHLKLDATGAGHLHLFHRVRPVRVIGLGNPHAIFKTAHLEEVPLHRIGRSLQRHNAFPRGVNVGYMQLMSREHIRLRVFERGAGETLACGTNACAAVVAGVLGGDLQRQVRVELPGGQVWVEWKEANNMVYLTGPASSVFTGQFKIIMDDYY